MNFNFAGKKHLIEKSHKKNVIMEKDTLALDLKPSEGDYLLP